MASSVVVTGAAGFIGRNMVAALNGRGVGDVLLVDTLGTDDKWQSLVGLTFDDIVSPATFLAKLDDDHAMAGVRTVIHLGACSATTERDADYLLDNNYHYTRTLCEWGMRKGVRVIYASSAATYGGGELGFSDSDTVTGSLRPLNMYGYSKQLVDLWALRTGALDRIAGLKFFNVYGEYEQHKDGMRSVVSKAFDEINRTGSLSLFRSHRPDYLDGQQLRDFIYVQDVVNVMLWLVDNPSVNGLYNCGSGNARTWVDLGRAAFAAMSRPENITFIDMPLGLREQYQYHTEAPMSKLRTAGYAAPFNTLEDGVAQYVQWLSSHVSSDSSARV